MAAIDRFTPEYVAQQVLQGKHRGTWNGCRSVSIFYRNGLWPAAKFEVDVLNRGMYVVTL